MEISASMVKELREKTGVGMMRCKKALTEADGDVAEAGGWRDTRALKLSYQQSDARTMLRVVNAGE